MEENRTSLILETDVVIDYLRGNNEKIINNIENLVSKGTFLTITQITLSELWFGVYYLQKKQKQIAEGAKLNDFILNLPEIINLSNDSSKIYGKLGAELERSGLRIPKFDLLNASIAIAHNMRLITKDRRHFPRIKEIVETDFLEFWD